jgi:hypothetical protein
VKTASPLIFWLLLAATLAVDAVAIYWLQQEQTATNAAVLFDALCFSQLSVAAIWAVFTARGKAIAAVLLIGSILVAAAVTGWLVDMRVAEWAAFFGAYVTLLVLALWILKHTAWWRSAIPRVAETWQFSVGHLLALMTVVAVLLTLFRRSEYLEQVASTVTTDILTNCGLAIAAVFVWTKPWRTPIRLTLLGAIAGLFGLADWASDLWFGNLANPTGDELLQSIAGGIIQILVISAWLELGQIIPRDNDRADHDAAKTA